MDGHISTSAQTVLAEAALAQSKIKTLKNLYWAYRSEEPVLQELYDDIVDISKIENNDKFLSYEENQQPLLQNCYHLLDDSRNICIALHNLLRDFLKLSTFWESIDKDEIQPMISAAGNGSAKLHISLVSLELLVKVMQM
ncbi:hypothetical protein MKX08_003308 [Trichoderma sp. CBMAI-0020]|nr:hypothetical protein MKX08_003308 [Trichoderma sp. CBMAI-0020]